MHKKPLTHQQLLLGLLFLLDSTRNPIAGTLAHFKPQINRRKLLFMNKLY